MSDDVTTRGKVLFLLLTATLSVSLLFLFIPKTVTEVKIDRAYACGNSCLTMREAVIVGSSPVHTRKTTQVGWNIIDNGYEVTGKDITFRTNDGRQVTHEFDESTPATEGQRVILGMWNDTLMTYNGSYVHTAWPSHIVALFLFLPPAVVGSSLLVYRLFQKRRYPKDERLGYTPLSFGLSLVSLLLVFAVTWWTVPAFLLSVAVPLGLFVYHGRSLREQN